MKPSVSLLDPAVSTLSVPDGQPRRHHEGNLFRALGSEVLARPIVPAVFKASRQPRELPMQSPKGLPSSRRPHFVG